MDDYDKFKHDLLHLNDTRKHKINKSYGVYDAYRYIRKNKWVNYPRPVTTKEFYKIIRTINNHLADLLSKGHDVILPFRLGRLEVRKIDVSPVFKDGKVRVRYAINWDETIKLWYKYPEERANKTMVKSTDNYVYKILYNKTRAIFKNLYNVSFKAHRKIKLKLRDEIRNNNIEAFELKKYDK